jgi:hypothetical protein
MRSRRGLEFVRDFVACGSSLRFGLGYFARPFRANLETLMPATCRWTKRLVLAVVLSTLAAPAARADETVSVGGSRAVLIRPKAPRASVILMPGGDGSIRAGENGDIHGQTGNQLVRTRQAYAARGLGPHHRCRHRSGRGG